MKIILFALASILFQIIALAQTPKQIKQMEGAKRKADSIIGLPRIKDMKQKVKTMEAEFEKQPKKQPILT